MTQEADKTDVLSLSVRQFIEASAAGQPTPGGGSIAGVAGALAAALAEMALAYTRGKKKFAAHEEYHARLAGRLARARRMFEDLVADDIAAYRLYQQAAGMDEGADKPPQLQLALAAAIDVPRQSAKLALAVLDDMLEFAGRCSRHLLSDLTAGAALAAAVARISDYNVRTNVRLLDDPAAASDLLGASAADLGRAQSLLAEIEQAATAAAGG